MDLPVSPRDAAALMGQLQRLASAAEGVASLAETEPELAGQCGVEICSLEARMLLSGGALARAAATAAEVLRTGRPAVLAAADVGALTQLEGVVARTSARISLKEAALEAEANQEPLARMTNLLALAGGAYGLYKTFF